MVIYPVKPNSELILKGLTPKVTILFPQMYIMLVMHPCTTIMRPVRLHLL